MPRFKVVDYSPRLLPVDLSRQLIPGTFEFALHHLLEHEIDLSKIESRYCNEQVGASPTSRVSCSRSCCWPTPAGL